MVCSLDVKYIYTYIIITFESSMYLRQEIAIGAFACDLV